MVIAAQRPDDVSGTERTHNGGLATLAPAMGLGWVGQVLGGVPMLVALAALGAVLSLACGRHLTRLLQLEAGLIVLLATALLLA